VLTISETERSDDGGEAGEPSIVIVSHNTREDLQRCLGSIASATREVVVVDSGSSDGSVGFVLSRHPEVRVLALDNVGFGAAANAGIAATSGQYVLLLNADARPRPGAVMGLTALAARCADAGMIGPLLSSPDGTAQRSVFANPRGPISLALWVFAPRLVTAAYQAFRLLTRTLRRHSRAAMLSEVQEVVGAEYVQGSAILLRRQAFDAVGGFDERFFMYCEEADMCHRLREAGWSVLFTPAFEFVHVGGASARQRADAMYRELLRAHLLLLAKHRGRGPAERGRRLVVLALRLRGMLHTGATRRSYASAGAALARDDQLGLTFGP
jgi:GT2 family glycosyltransferase